MNLSQTTHNAGDKIIAILVLLCLVGREPLLSQSRDTIVYREAGLPIIQNFSPKDYDAYSQNWAVVQGHDGVMYFGNGAGVLTYDGVNWRLIPAANNTVVRSLAVEETGRIYVGALGDFGYLESDAKGELQYVSLVDRIAPEHRDFGDIWDILLTSRGVFFRAAKHLFLFRDDGQPDEMAATGVRRSLRFWQTNHAFFAGQVVNDTIFIALTKSDGVVKLAGDSLQQVALSPQIRDEEIYVLFPLWHDSTKLLVVTRTGTAYIFDGSTFEPLPRDPALTAHLGKSFFFRGAALPDGSFALGTTSGMVIISRESRLLNILNKAAGLMDEDVLFIYPDREGGTWLAFNNGLARVDWSAPLSVYSEALGIKSNVEAIVRHAGILYAGTGRGVFYLTHSEKPGESTIFKPVPGLNQQTWSMLSTDEGLFVGTTYGLYLVRSGSQPVALTDSYAFAICRSQDTDNLLSVGNDQGLILMQKVSGAWRLAGKFSGITQQVRTVVEETPGGLWLGTRSSGFLRVSFPEGFASSAKDEILTAQNVELQIEHFDKNDGVPDGFALTYRIAGKTVFATQKGLRRFDETSRRFVPDSSFGAVFADTTRWIYPVHEDPEGNVWLNSATGTRSEIIRIARQPHNDNALLRTPFLRASELGGAVNAIYADPAREDVVWLGTSQNLLRYDLKIEKDYTVDFPCLVRRVVAKGDSVIFAGASASIATAVPDLVYAVHDLRFVYAATSFEAPAQIRYQTWLEGFDDTWSNWTHETQKDYTNLPEGEYLFRVRAKNVYGQLSSVGEFAFNILPPWYRTWWAYGFYLMLVVAGIFTLVQYRLRKANRRTRQLEAIVAERTRELAEKNQELRELDHLKSRFFANISHEFRTPLTLILGPIDNMKQRATYPGDKNDLRLLENNAVRLRHLIGQLLDLSKFEAGQMTLRVCEQNIVPLIRQLTGTFESLARQKRVNLHFESSREDIPVYFEQDKIEKVMYNLLSNALKFTPAGGSVLVSTELDEAQFDPEVPQVGEVKITVRDSGIGIPKDRLPHIFDRFFQVDSSSTRAHEGTGIGLALTLELVQVHGGSISVESHEGFGTTFQVRLPPGRAHIADEQIVWEGEDSEVEKPAEMFEMASDLEREAEDAEPVVLQTAAPKGKKAAAEIVLVAEDNPDLRTYICEHLQSDHKLVTAGDGEEALRLALEHVPDLIITDVMMPKMDGYDLVRQLREDQLTSHIPIIMLTAKAGEDARIEGLETGVDAYLIKPFSTKELRVRVRKLIEMRRKLREQMQRQPIITASKVMVTSVDQQFLQRLQQIVEENIGDEDFEVDELCRQIGMSKSHLHRKLNALLGRSPASYVRRVRMERAKQLLEDKAGNVSEIALQVGYSSFAAFSRAFSEAHGKPPSAFLKDGVQK